MINRVNSLGEDGALQLSVLRISECNLKDPQLYILSAVIPHLEVFCMGFNTEVTMNEYSRIVESLTTCQQSAKLKKLYVDQYDFLRDCLLSTPFIIEILPPM